MGRRRAPPPPLQTSLIVLMYEMANHKQSKIAEEVARERGIRLVRISRKSAVAQKQLETALKEQTVSVEAPPPPSVQKHKADVFFEQPPIREAPLEENLKIMAPKKWVDMSQQEKESAVAAAGLIREALIEFVNRTSCTQSSLAEKAKIRPANVSRVIRGGGVAFSRSLGEALLEAIERSDLGFASALPSEVAGMGGWARVQRESRKPVPPSLPLPGGVSPSEDRKSVV